MRAPVAVIHLGMKLVLNAAFDARLGDGIAHYALRVAPARARLCEPTAVTPDPVSFPPVCRTRRTLAGPVLTREDCSGQSRSCTDVSRATATASRLRTTLPRTLNARAEFAFWATTQTIRRTDGVVTDSEHTRNNLTRVNLLPGLRIEVVHAGLGIEPCEHNRGFGLDLRPLSSVSAPHTRTSDDSSRHLLRASRRGTTDSS